MILLLLIQFTAPADAQTTWQIAPGPSLITFKIKHLIFLIVEGKFRKFDGTVVTHNEDMTNSDLEVRIQADSIYTGIEDRDRDLSGQNFFDSEKFPEIIFKSQKIEKGNEEGLYRIWGNLTMKGITKPIELIATYQNKRQLPSGKIRMDFVVTATLNRFDYGIDWNDFLDSKAIVGDQVEIQMKIALLKEA